MAKKADKRKKVALSPEEMGIIRWLFFKAMVPVVIIVVISSAVLFLGFESLMRKVSLVNYGIAPRTMTEGVSQFITTYMVIAVLNVLLMAVLIGVVLYLLLHEIVLPVMRITREIRSSLDSGVKRTLVVRNTDRLLVPLVDLINRLM
jgi:uncharacterized membrane protein YjgN (DUF898 family)